MSMDSDSPYLSDMINEERTRWDRIRKSAVDGEGIEEVEEEDDYELDLECDNCGEIYCEGECYDDDDDEDEEEIEWEDDDDI